MIPQRQLVYQLKLAIDQVRARERTWHDTAAATRRLAALVDANGAAALTPYVLHNIGARRSAWLLAWQRARASAPLPFSTDARSSFDA